MFNYQLEQLKAAQEKAAVVSEALTSLEDFVGRFKDANGASFRSEPLMEGQHYSLREVIFETQKTLSLILTAPMSKKYVVASDTFNNIATALDGIAQSVASARDLAALAINDKRPMLIVAGSRLIHQSTSEDLYTFYPHMVRAVKHLSVLTVAMTTLVAYAKVRDMGAQKWDRKSIDADVKFTADALRESEAAARRIKSITNNVSGTEEEAQNKVGAIASAVDEASKRLAELELIIASVSDQSNSAASKIQSDVALTSSRAEDVTRIAAQADELLSGIVSFSASIDIIRKNVDGIKNSAERAVSVVNDQSSKVMAMIAEADKMVSGATTAGLTTAFANEKKSLDRQLSWAMVSFAIGIAFLFVTTVGLAAYVLEVPVVIGGVKLAQSGATHVIGDEVTLAGIISRAIIILAPFWFTSFAARRYRRLFDLRQQYSHKYNMAFSMDGFKNQAPKHKDDIAGWVFKIVSESPVQQSGGRQIDHVPSLHEFASETVEQIKKVFEGKDGKV